MLMLRFLVGLAVQCTWFEQIGKLFNRAPTTRMFALAHSISFKCMPQAKRAREVFLQSLRQNMPAFFGEHVITHSLKNNCPVSWDFSYLYSYGKQPLINNHLPVACSYHHLSMQPRHQQAQLSKHRQSLDDPQGAHNPHELHHPQAVRLLVLRKS